MILKWHSRCENFGMILYKDFLELSPDLEASNVHFQTNRDLLETVEKGTAMLRREIKVISSKVCVALK